MMRRRIAMAMAKLMRLLRRKQPQPTLTSPRRKQPQPTLTSPHIPLDLVAEILCRLSVKQLIQLTCVCKSWNSLISGDSTFAKKHLRLSSSRHHLIVTPHSSRDFLFLHSPISSIVSSTPTTTVPLFRYPQRWILRNGYWLNGASTCDGILCFRIDESFAVLCNPSIKKFKILPPLRFPYQAYIQISYTLVYDRFIDNYKIIALNSLSREKEVNVYTLGTDHWTRIRDFPGPNLIPMSIPGIFVNDSVNWLTHKSGCYAQLIVSLDLEKESYQKLSLPVFDPYVINSYISLGTLRGCLSLFYNRRDKFSDVWIMKEYGNENSWTKLFSVPHTFPAIYTKVLYILEDDRLLMEFFKNDCSLVVYDSINNTFKIPNFQDDIHQYRSPKVYVESLISPF